MIVLYTISGSGGSGQCNSHESVEKKMDERFEEVNRRFEKLEKKMDGRFKEVNRMFKESDTKTRMRFEHIRNALRTILTTRGWEEIYPMETIDAQSKIYIPEHFPRTVNQF